jgi:DNA-binding transcriptional regulator GbsR (MarR family)
MRQSIEVMSLTTEKEEFIEDVGIFFVEMHLPRIAGKILGFLLISSPSYQTAGQLMTATGGSKGSISTMTRFLMQNDFIEMIGIPGKRDIYYQIKAHSAGQWLIVRVSFIKTLHRLADRALKLSSRDNFKQLQWLQDVHDLNAFFEREFPVMMERWMNERESTHSEILEKLSVISFQE